MSASSTTLVLRVRSKSGRCVVNGLTSDSSLSELHKALEEKTNIPPDSQRILCGYPPKEIQSYEPTATLQSLQIHSGESIIVEEYCEPRVNDTAGDEVSRTLMPSTGSHSVLEETGVQMLARKVVPADNSCLFRSISILLSDGSSAMGLRELAAGIILSDPDKYNTAILGKTNPEYVGWLLREESWGGAIELSVFSEYYQTELDVVDIQTQRIDRFGENQGYEQRALLIYDGIHYDPLVLEGPGGSVQQTVFHTDKETVLFQALQMAEDANQARQYTDVNKFSLRCLVCGAALTGQTHAQDHARTTGHINFGEI